MMENYFIVRFALHFVEVMITLLYHRQRHSFSEYIFHHFVGIGLLTFAYGTNNIVIGSVVTFIHDITDIFVHLLKMTIDLVRDEIMLLCYFMMVSSWIFFRIYYFPIYCIKPMYDIGYQSNFIPLRESSRILLFLQSCVYIIHVFWLGLMFRGVLARYLFKNFNAGKKFL